VNYEKFSNFDRFCSLNL